MCVCVLCVGHNVGLWVSTRHPRATQPPSACVMLTVADCVVWCGVVLSSLLQKRQGTQPQSLQLQAAADREDDEEEKWKLVKKVGKALAGTGQEQGRCRAGGKGVGEWGDCLV